MLDVGGGGQTGVLVVARNSVSSRLGTLPFIVVFSCGTGSRKPGLGSLPSFVVVTLRAGRGLEETRQYRRNVRVLMISNTNETIPSACNIVIRNIAFQRQEEFKHEIIANM